MEAALQWGLDFIRHVQSFANPSLTFFMRLVTNLGSAAVSMILISFVYWCVDEKKGLRLGAVVLISDWINVSLKFLLNQPRPFFKGYDPSVGMISERLGGFPSGHAQNSLVMWTVTASLGINSPGTRKSLFGIAALICLLVSFSRIYLGVHFPTDILGGWILGAIVLCGYFKLVPVIEKYLATGGLRSCMIAGAALAFLMILYRPGNESLHSGGMTLGLCAGYCLNKKYIGFKSSVFLADTGQGQKKYLILAARFVLGLAVLFFFYTASEKLIGQFRYTDNYPLFLFLRFVLTALWVSAGAPWLFRFLKLAGTEQKQ